MIVGLCGNPNVGKSTLFNRLTGMHQHTGNWPGKTVGSASGRWRDHLLVDTPGSYSLAARSAEEEVTRDFILFGPAERLIVVADATNLRRSILLALQVLEVRRDLVLCVNLMDEARRRGIPTDIPRLERVLGIPVVPVSAAVGEGMDALERALALPAGEAGMGMLPPGAKEALTPLAEYLEGQPLPPYWLARSLLSPDEGLRAALAQHFCLDPARDQELARRMAAAQSALKAAGYDADGLEDAVGALLLQQAAELCPEQEESPRSARSAMRLDRFLTHPVSGTAVMLGLLMLVLWLTVKAANVPSEYLSRFLFSLGEKLRGVLVHCGVSAWLTAAFCDGIWRTTAWVVGVMLPPMAIFFPLFTLLEDLGYLPRAAFVLDGAFQRCGACGKQGLCMMMGLGCNAVGVSGSRIIDSPRERLLSQLTNSFMPCNGRFPTMLALSAVFFAGGGAWGTAFILTALIALGAALTFAVSWALSRLLLRGEQGSFALELPPFRKPQWGSVLVRSVMDRTLFVLGRAVSVAAPAGLLLWCLANVSVGSSSLLQWCRTALEVPGRVLGLDGAILLGFLLALPANEIALPAMLLIYTSGSCLQEYGSLAELGSLLRANGWDAFTAAAVLLFTLCHWPCAATLLTVKRESGSWGCVALSAGIPTLCGVILCLLLTVVRRILVA